MTREDLLNKPVMEVIYWQDQQAALVFVQHMQNLTRAHPAVGGHIQILLLTVIELTFGSPMEPVLFTK